MEPDPLSNCFRRIARVKSCSKSFDVENKKLHCENDMIKKTIISLSDRKKRA